MNGSQNLVQKLWNYCNILRDDGLSYGDYVEQLTFLLFLKMAHEQTLPPWSRSSVVPAEYAWPTLMSKSGDDLEVHYRHTLEQLGKAGGMLGLTFRKAQNKVQDPAKLERLIKELIDREQWLSLDADVKGDAYEGLLEKNAQDVKGGAGQYFTPRALIRAVVDVVRPAPGELICDPACGTGGFLLAAHDYVVHQNPHLDKAQKKFLKLKALKGVELVDGVARLCAMNLMLHGVGPSGDEAEPPIVGGKSSIDAPTNERFDVVLTNPPFGKKSSVMVVNDEGDQERQSLTVVRDDFWASTSNKQLNFVQHVKTILKINGRAAIVVPDNVLFEGGAGETVRRKLLHECDVHTLLRLPTGIFYAQGVKANLLFFDRKPASETPWTKQVWVYDLRTNEHFTLKTNPLKRTDLDEFVSCYHAENRHERVATWSEANPNGRWRSYSYEELIARDKANLDVFWLKDESLEDSENLPSCPHGYSALPRASCRCAAGRLSVLEELSGVRERPMIIPMTTTARPQQRYDHRLRDLVQRTGDVTIATDLGVPRSTARGWLGMAPKVVVSVDVTHLKAPELQQEIVKLRRRVKKLTALLRLALALLRSSGFTLTRERLPDERAKIRILRAVDRAREFVPLRALLRFLRLSPTRFHAWRRLQQACALDDRSSCPHTSPHRLTPTEVLTIADMVTAPAYRHVPTGTLAVLAQRLGKVWASPSTWYHLVRKFGWRRPRLRVHPAKPKLGLRTTRANEMWHIDTTVIRLLDGTRAYLHAVIDNFSRRILAWRVAETFAAVNSVIVLVEASRGATPSETTPVVLADAGVENVNAQVDDLITTGVLRRVLAFTELKFSNSMIEAWWRSLKHQWLYLHPLDSVTTVHRLVEFYVHEHNRVLPHSAFRGQTPDEMYFGTGDAVPADLTSRAAAARRARVEANQSAACETCPSVDAAA